MKAAQHPFTVAWVRETIEALGDRYSIPSESELETLAEELNQTFIGYAEKDQTRASQARDSEVRNALKVLARFHEDRRKEVLAAPDISPNIFVREMYLRDMFIAYERELSALWCWHFEIPMDLAAWSAFPKNWRDIAERIADAFVQAMKESNPGRTFGFSDDGPAVKFTLATLERISAAPQAGSPENARYRIAQRIRELKAKKKRKEKPDL